MRPLLASLLVLLALASPIPTLAQVKNPGFEIADETSSQAPKDWRIVGTGGVIALDAEQKHDGERSLRIERKAGATFTGMGQFLDAAPWRGKLVRFSAWLRAENLDGSAGLWIRGDSSIVEKRTFANAPVTPTSAWSRQQVIVDIDPDAERVALGATLSASGLLWVDSVELTVLDPMSAEKLSDEADRYLVEAADTLRANALRAGGVDWDAALARARLIAAGAQTPAQAAPGVSYLLRALKDGHSFMLPPERARALSENVRIDDFNLRSEAVLGKGFLRVPGYAGTNPGRELAFERDLVARIRSLASTPVCGWIVDLREDTGGNMYPMLRGLAPLLGSGDLGYFVAKDRNPWSAGGSGKDRHDYRLELAPALTDAPVAVLIGARTASSGEAVAVSFIQRPNTRSFGSPTAGQSTGNRGFTLTDGAMMLVTTAVFADRAGNPYGGAIAPDEAVASGPEGVMLAQDPVVKKAVEWLDLQSPCLARASEAPRGSPRRDP